MESKFELQIFRFGSGVVAELYEDKLLVKADNGASTIESKNLDNLNYIDHIEPKLTTTALMTRTFGLGFLLLFFTGNQWRAATFNSNIFQSLIFYTAIFLLLMSVVAFFTSMMDDFLGFNLYRQLIAKYFAHRGYAVTVGNKTGNNIKFFAPEEELNKVKKLEVAINDLKKHLETKQTQPQQTVTTSANNTQPNTHDISLENLKKLGELYQTGILTKDEFEKKKTELLSK